MIAIIISYSFLGFLIVITLLYVFCRKNYLFIYDHRLLFVIGLVFSRSLTYYAIVDMLMWYFTDHEVPVVKATVLSNVQEALSSVFVIFMAHSADSYVGRFRTILFSTTAFIGGVMLLLLFDPYDVTWLVVIALVLLSLGKSGDTILGNIFNDLTDEVDKSEGRNKKRSHARAAIWRRIAHSSGAISATMWIAPDALGGTNTTWKFSFLTCLISMTITLMIFCKGHKVYHQGKLVHRPIEIFFRVIRARIKKLYTSKSRCSSNTSPQERYLERNQENEGIAPERTTLGESVQEDNSYKEDVKVIRSLLRMFPLWGTFIVVSLISAVGDTLYYIQYDSLENEYDIPVQIYFVIQEFSYFVIITLYQWTCFRHNQKLKIGVGMICSILSCIFAWQLQVHMVKEVRNHIGDDNSEISISFLWLVPQFVMLGCMEGLTESGLLKFYRSQVDKPIQNYGEEYMEIVMFLGQVLNAGIMFILGKWFNDMMRAVQNYYLSLTCVCSVNFIIYCCVAIWFYKDTKQDHNSSVDDLHHHD